MKERTTRGVSSERSMSLRRPCILIERPTRIADHGTSQPFVAGLAADPVSLAHRREAADTAVYLSDSTHVASDLRRASHGAQASIRV